MNQNVKYTKVKLVDLTGGAKWEDARKLFTKFIIPDLKKNKEYNKIKLLKSSDGYLEFLDKNKIDITEEKIKKGLSYSVKGKKWTPSATLGDELQKLQNSKKQLKYEFKLNDYIGNINNILSNENITSIVKNIPLLKGKVYINTDTNKLNIKLKKDNGLANLLSSKSYEYHKSAFINAIKIYLIKKIKIFLGKNLKFDPELQDGLLNDLYKTEEIETFLESIKIIRDSKKKGLDIKTKSNSFSDHLKNVMSKEKILNDLKKNNKIEFQLEYEIDIDFDKIKKVFKEVLERQNLYDPNALQISYREIKELREDISKFPGQVKKDSEDLAAMMTFNKTSEQIEEEKETKRKNEILKQRQAEPPIPTRTDQKEENLTGSTRLEKMRLGRNKAKEALEKERKEAAEKTKNLSMILPKKRAHLSKSSKKRITFSNCNNDLECPANFKCDTKNKVCKETISVASSHYPRKMNYTKKQLDDYNSLKISLKLNTKYIKKSKIQLETYLKTDTDKTSNKETQQLLFAIKTTNLENVLVFADRFKKIIPKQVDGFLDSLTSTDKILKELKEKIKTKLEEYETRSRNRNKQLKMLDQEIKLYEDNKNLIDQLRNIVDINSDKLKVLDKASRLNYLQLKAGFNRSKT